MKQLVYSSLILVPMLCSAQVPSTSVTEAGESARSVPAIAQQARTPETSLSQVREQLKLTDSQQPLWAAYVARIDGYTKVYYQERPATALSGDAAPRQIGRLFDNMQNRLATLDEIERSAKALYAVLDTSQRQIADQMLLSTIPVFASSANATCPPPNDGKPRSEKAEMGQHKRRGSAMGGMGQ